MSYQQLRFLFLNVGHFLDHLFVLIFATAALRLTIDWELNERIKEKGTDRRGRPKNKIVM